MHKRSKRVKSQRKRSDDNHSDDEDLRYDIDIDPLVNAISFGWTEDGRCGYLNKDNTIQHTPRPIFEFNRKIDKLKRQFICKRISAGSRHTLFLMINCRKEVHHSTGRKAKKVMITGLNQVGLCEQPGHNAPVDTPLLHPDEVPINISAGHGTSFIITRVGNVYSFGQGRYGVLGHGHEEPTPYPLHVASLERYKITKISVGEFHAMGVTDTGALYAWGRNHKGQLGLDLKSDVCSHLFDPTRVDYFTNRDFISEVACGKEHTLVLARIVRKDNSIFKLIFAWGDHSRGQLGGGDEKFRARPQEMRWVSAYLRRVKRSPIAIAAGGFHNLVLTTGVGQILSWGGGDYGQLGSGYMWDEPRPWLIVGLRDVTHIRAGYQHSMAIKEGADEGFPEVWAWGHNAYGELGLGDTDIRLQPTYVSALEGVRVLDVSCGYRHTVVLTSHKPLLNKDDPVLKGYFEAIEQGEGTNVKQVLKEALQSRGINPEVLEQPDKSRSRQPGAQDEPLENHPFEKGLRYCLDTVVDDGDWRRKTYETCFTCPPIGLKTICLSCARLCHANRYLEPVFRRRHKGDVCDCSRGPYCRCSWSEIRAKYDEVAAQYADLQIGPCDLRDLISDLREPALLDDADFTDCLHELAKGEENTDLPRIDPVKFEQWYIRFFEKYE